MDKGFDLFSAFATDEVKENEGVEVPIGGGAVLKIARAGNSNFERVLLEKLEANKVALDSLPKKEALELDQKIYRQVVAETILVGWSGVAYKGKSLPYSIKAAEEMLAMPDFRRLVMQHASSIELYRAKLEEVDAKN